jgi:hypothetical protein
LPRNEISEVVFDIDAALLKFSQLSALAKPESSDMGVLRSIVKNGRDFSIRGAGADIWGDLNGSDPVVRTVRQHTAQFLRSIISLPTSNPESNRGFIAPHSERKLDGVTKWSIRVVWGAISLIHSLVGTFFRPKERNPKSSNRLERDPEAETAEVASPMAYLFAYRPPILLAPLIYSVNTISACLLPIVAIVVLANLHTKAQLLGTISGFTAVFAFVLTVFTSAGRVETFTATAA